MRKPPSLRVQAITWLAQREYSERELRAKLLRRMQVLQRRATSGASAASAVSSSAESAPAIDKPPEARRPCLSDDGEIDDVIAWLLQRGYLDEQRFVASRVHVRSERFGVSRIEQELSRHGLDLPADAAEALRTTELERAKTVWKRRFGSPPADIRDAARQARFLAGRGFSGDVIRRVVPRWLADRSSDLESD